MSTMYNKDMGVGVIGAGKFGLAHVIFWPKNIL